MKKKLLIFLVVIVLVCSGIYATISDGSWCKGQFQNCQQNCKHFWEDTETLTYQSCVDRCADDYERCIKEETE